MDLLNKKDARKVRNKKERKDNISVKRNHRARKQNAIKLMAKRSKKL